MRKKQFLNKYGRLTILKELDSIKYNRIVLVKCYCGKTKKCYLSHLKSGSTTSCGCYQKEQAKKFNFRHGFSTRKLVDATYRTWSNMLTRCENKKSNRYKRYGDRGIKVCKGWHRFVNFLNDMGDRPIGMTLDRIDNNKGYYKENCRWATSEQQANNKSSNRVITLDDRTMSLARWSRLLGVNRETLASRMRRGHSIKCSLISGKQFCLECGKNN